MKVAMIVLAAALPAAAAPQTSHHRDCGPDRQGHSSLGHDVGNVAVHQGSRVAGAAVAGPVGAAVAPVVTHHVGHAVKRVVKGRKDEHSDRENCPRNTQSRRD